MDTSEKYVYGQGMQNGVAQASQKDTCQTSKGEFQPNVLIAQSVFGKETPTGIFWNQEALSYEWLPTLQYIVRCCDKSLLANMLIEEYVAREDGAPKAKRRYAMERRLYHLFKTLCALPLCEKERKRRLLLPEEVFSLCEEQGIIEQHFLASLISLDDVMQRNAAPAKECFDIVRIPYTLLPWEEVLASRVWLGGLQSYQERYLVIASALWEMTYCGFDYQQVRKLQERMRQEQAGSDDIRQKFCSQQRLKKTKNSLGLICPNPYKHEVTACKAQCVSRLNAYAQDNFLRTCNHLSQCFSTFSGSAVRVRSPVN